MHDFGFFGEVVIWIAKPLSRVNFIGDGHLRPSDPQSMGEPDVLSTLGGGGDSSTRGWVPPQTGEPMGKGLPSMVGDGVWTAPVANVDIRVFELYGRNDGWVVNNGIPAGLELWERSRLLPIKWKG